MSNDTETAPLNPNDVLQKLENEAAAATGEAPATTGGGTSAGGGTTATPSPSAPPVPDVPPVPPSTSLDSKEEFEDNYDPEGPNPFAARQGKNLTWRDVNMTLHRSGEEPKKLLSHVWGQVPEQKTTALMGPSGAGKTSLLNILAGRAASKGNLYIEHDVRLNNYSVDPTNIDVRKTIAFVSQDDTLMITATPREAIRFSAKLRLPKSTTDEQLDNLTTRMLAELGLTACADTMVGGPLLKGISGGERKRTSVGVELVVMPSMVFLDEPTSGLDSYSAVQVCDVLRKVSRAGASVLFTIHQPSSEIFDSFDHLILLNKGRVMFQGPVKSVPEYFAARGHACPATYNPADWLMMVAQQNSPESLEKAGFFPRDELPVEKPSAALEVVSGRRYPVYEAIREDLHGKHVGSSTQIGMLVFRELTHIRRDRSVVASRMVVTTCISLLIGGLYFQVGTEDLSDEANLRSHFGALVSIMTIAMLSQVNTALLSFPDERPVFLREYSTNHYSVASYFLSRLTMEALIAAASVLILVSVIYLMARFSCNYGLLYANTYLFAMTSTALAVMIACASGGNAKLSMQMVPILFGPQILFSGFFVAPSVMPAALAWLRFIMPMTYAVQIAAIEEFAECSDNVREQKSCDELLDSLEINTDNELVAWLVLIYMFVLARLIALLLLRINAKDYL